MNPVPLDEILQAQQRGEARGIASVCSSHPFVLQTVISRAVRTGGPLLIESTCNQVSQFGGYTGMIPSDFVRFVRGMATQNGLPLERVLLGGDHLGPFPWRNEPADQAMQKAIDLVQAYVRAGYTKIHLDTSMGLGDDDPDKPLAVELAARRTAVLAAAAEECADPAALPRYVIGAEVPLPGGSAGTDRSIPVTGVDDTKRMLIEMQDAFRNMKVGPAWDRVKAMVVQPGVDFGDQFVWSYRPELTRDLVRFVETTPFICEVHSTDYQSRDSLKSLVRDHFAILKVGPALTFAFRETAFALARMEDELLPEAERSHLVETLESAMLRTPVHWLRHYRGSPQEQAFARKYSLSDRIRYYWPDAAVQSALGNLLKNLQRAPLPLTLLSQFMPGQFELVRTGRLENAPSALLRDGVERVLQDYEYACEI